MKRVTMELWIILRTKYIFCGSEQLIKKGLIEKLDIEFLLIYYFSSKRMQDVQDVYPRIYRQANVSYTPSKEIIEASKNTYYLEYKDKPLTRREMKKKLKKYGKVLSVLSAHNGIVAYVTVPSLEKNTFNVAEMATVMDDEVITYLQLPPHSVNALVNWFSTDNKAMLMYFDVKFAYKVYKKRKSLTKINKYYAIDKAAEHLQLLLSFSKTDEEMYVILSIQCLALQKKFKKLDVDIDYEKESSEMLETVQKWIKKKKSKL